ncbi:MAG: hypothetical protein ACLPYY_00830 [Acidimicrobiales bacterium]
MRSKRVAQACDMLPGCSTVLARARHDLEIPATLTPRVRLDPRVVESQRMVMAMAMAPTSAVVAQSR